MTSFETRYLPIEELKPLHRINRGDISIISYRSFEDIDEEVLLYNLSSIGYDERDKDILVILDWFDRIYGFQYSIKQNYYRTELNILWKVTWYKPKEDWNDQDGLMYSSRLFGETEKFPTMKHAFIGIIDYMYHLVKLNGYSA